MAGSEINHLVQACTYGRCDRNCTSRKSRLMKWIDKMFKKSNSGASDGRYPKTNGDENTSWHAPFSSLDDKTRRGKEDLDHAIALSLADDSIKPNGCKRDDAYDEDLARAIQESLKAAPPYLPYAPYRYLPPGQRKCAGCKGDILSGRYLSCMDALWHPQCFRCHACGQPICESEFSLSGGDPYHKYCYKALHHPKCDVCHQFIPINRAGMIEYRAHPYWGQKYCPSHEHDKTARCCSCERMESRSGRAILLEDGRSLCLECLDSAVMDNVQSQAIYHAIRDYYEGMNMKIDQQIPMLLVERQALNDAMEGQKDGHHHMPETRGLCLSEEQTVSIIYKRPKIGGNRIIDMKTEPRKLTRICEVTAILVLYGLPRLLTGSILAHELMHGWLRLKGYRNLKPEIEEGICQVMSYMWLESEVMAGSGSSSSTASTSSGIASFSYSTTKKMGTNDIEKKLGNFYMHQIANDISAAYGEGFRAANKAVNRYGLRRTLDHIQLTGNLPD